MQAAKVALSSEQVNVTGDSVSLKLIDAEDEAVVPVGPLTDGTGGGVVSTVQLREVAAPRFPAASTWRALKLCEPCASEEYG